MKNSSIIVTIILVCAAFFASQLLLMSRQIMDSDGRGLPERPASVREYPIERFSGVSVSGPIQAAVVRDTSYGVKLTGSDRALRETVVEKEGDVLVIRLKKGTKLRGLLVEAEVSMPKLVMLETQGECSVDFKGFSEKTCRIETGGSSRACGRDNVLGDVSVVCAGSSRADLMTSRVMNARVDASGSGRVGLEMAGGILSGTAADNACVTYCGSTVEQNVRTMGPDAEVLAK
jgi:hypothetical protein